MSPASAQRDPSYTLVYILGSGYCGSTLLDMLLNAHSKIVALGEIGTKGRDRHRWLLSPFWQIIRETYERTQQMNFEDIDLSPPRWSTIRSWSQRDLMKWARANAALLETVHTITEASILTDSTKSSQRLYLLARSGLLAIKVIHLVRDGRAVINSHVRRRRRFWAAFRQWASSSLFALYFCHSPISDSWLRVRYEDLSTAPELTLRRICAFLRIDFEDRMLAYRSRPYNGIGGNIMRIRSGEEIRLDDRWKRELAVKHRLLFLFAGGWLNALYGY